MDLTYYINGKQLTLYKYLSAVPSDVMSVKRGNGTPKATLNLNLNLNWLAKGLNIYNITATDTAFEPDFPHHILSGSTRKTHPNQNPYRETFRNSKYFVG